MKPSGFAGNAMFVLLCTLLVTTATLAQNQPAARLAGASFKVADLEKARQFYTGMFGLEEAFDLKDATGAVQSIFFKVNDDQYLEFSPGAPQNFHLEHISFLSPDLKKSAAILRKRGIAPGKIGRSADGNLFFAIKDPDQVEIDFVQYMRGSQQTRHRSGKENSDAVSDHLQHVGLGPADNAATLSFYRDKLGLQQFSVQNSLNNHVRLPGSPDDVIELMTTLTQPVSSRQHIAFAVPDIQRAYKQLRAHGLPASVKPYYSPTGHWALNLRDPNGLRVEIAGEPAPAPQKEK